MNKYNIDIARIEHIAALPTIERAAAALFPDHLITPELRNSVVPLDQLEKAQIEKRLWVAVDSIGEAVGFAIASSTNESAFLQEISVHPQHQQQGLGRRLIDRVIEWARQRGYASLTLTTFEQVRWNAPFYQGMGFCQLRRNQLSDDLRRRLQTEEQAGLKERVAMRLTL